MITPEDTETAMEAEFDTMAEWTADAVAALGPHTALPAACRGSGSPAALAWLADHLNLATAHRFLDTGAGVGGPAAWLVEEGRVTRAFVTEPMHGAVRASRRLFGHPAATAWSETLPLRSGAFDAAWLLGVLSTTDRKAEVVAELHRVLAPGGRLGILAYLRTVDELTGGPEGNSFANLTELEELLATAGFEETSSVWAHELPGPPPEWQQVADEASAHIASAHEGEPAVARAHDQEARMGTLLKERRVMARLCAARRL